MKDVTVPPRFMQNNGFEGYVFVFLFFYLLDYYQLQRKVQLKY